MIFRYLSDEELRADEEDKEDVVSFGISNNWTVDFYRKFIFFKM